MPYSTLGKVAAVLVGVTTCVPGCSRPGGPQSPEFGPTPLATTTESPFVVPDNLTIPDPAIGAMPECNTNDQADHFNPENFQYLEYLSQLNSHELSGLLFQTAEDFYNIAHQTFPLDAEYEVRDLDGETSLVMTSARLPEGSEILTMTKVNDYMEGACQLARVEMLSDVGSEGLNIAAIRVTGIQDVTLSFSINPKTGEPEVSIDDRPLLADDPDSLQAASDTIQAIDDMLATIAMLTVSPQDDTLTQLPPPYLEV